jgi:hypothetical protein
VPIFRGQSANCQTKAILTSQTPCHDAMDGLLQAQVQNNYPGWLSKKKIYPGHDEMYFFSIVFAAHGVSFFSCFPVGM